ncbi:LysM peptidoglycan-binding domain-containing protein [Planctomycetota bacterium]
MRGYIIGLIVVIIVGLAGLVVWKMISKEEPVEEILSEEVGFRPIQDIIQEYTTVTETTSEISGETSSEFQPAVIVPDGITPAITPVSTYEQFEYYAVRKKDTLWDISKKFYGTGTRYKSIFEANRGKLSSLNVYLQPGMKLAIPKKGIRTQLPKEYSLENINPQGGTYYTVRKGDSLEKIAARFYKKRSKYRVIFEANRDKLTTPETTLRIGWKLFVPSLTEPVRRVPSPMPPVGENIPMGVPE